MYHSRSELVVNHFSNYELWPWTFPSACDIIVAFCGGTNEYNGSVFARYPRRRRLTRWRNRGTLTVRNYGTPFAPSRGESQECCPAAGVLYMARSTVSGTQRLSQTLWRPCSSSLRKSGALPLDGAICAQSRPIWDHSHQTGRGLSS